jgi:HrpA-like RNA helicase
VVVLCVDGWNPLDCCFNSTLTLVPLYFSYPIREVFLEDLLGPCFSLQQKTVKMAGQLLEQCNNMKCRSSPPMSYMEKLFSLVANLAVTIGQPGSAVLIFVPGMNEILAITELIEQLFVPGVRFTCLPVHSEIPFEDQMNVFDAAADDECRIIIATNSAESSVTLPALDHVICLGLCKQIVYNEMSHRQMLLPTWISRASATQRAGRTGRLRPGTVYRCYSRNCYNNYMVAHEPGEMLRIPLDSVILMLKGILSEDDGVTDALLDCLEPPNTSTIDRSFQSLHQSHFITTPHDGGRITTLGSFVSVLGIDLSLGSLIGLGIQFGVGPEAIAMAGVLSFPKSPFVMSNALVHGTTDYNSKYNPADI